jgi:ppGpp synthetase/RelA/SpoT-type nucleotidyltranferase
MEPSAGYRAVHLVVVHESRLVEVQVRTLLQDRWAGISETLAYELDPMIKYGGGSTQIAALLMRYSRLVANVEDLDRPLKRGSDEHDVDPKDAGLRTAFLAQIETLEKALLNQRGKSEDERRP